MTSNFLSLNFSKTDFLLIGLKRQLAKIHRFSTSIDTGTQSALNLGFIFDEYLSFCDQISALSKFCYHHIRALHCIRPYLNLHTAKTTATAIVHSKLDCCNSLLWFSEISNKSSSTHPAYSWSNCSQFPEFQHITHILKSLYWRKVSERIYYLFHLQHHAATVYVWLCV